jgi:hypothetical protein
MAAGAGEAGGGVIPKGEKYWSFWYVMTFDDIAASRGEVRSWAMRRVEEELWRCSGQTPQTHRIMWGEREGQFGSTILEGRLYTIETFNRLARLRRVAA